MVLNLFLNSFLYFLSNLSIALATFFASLFGNFIIISSLVFLSVSVNNTADGQEVKVAFAGAGIRSLLTKYAVLKKL